jgi:serine/threonine-protein kinase
MSSEVPAIRPFGPYLLLRNTGADVLGTLYRAGTLGKPGLKPLLHLRVFDGPAVDRGALLKAMEQTVDVLEGVGGPSVAAGAVLGAVDDLPFAGVDVPPGQALDAVLAERSGGGSLSPEQALFVTERILAALAAARPVALVAEAPHGFLVPSFVLVSYDGEVRVFGFGLGPGLLSSVRNPRTREAFGPYVAPEVLASGRPTPAGDVFSVAAILFEMLTGRPPAAGAADAEIETALLAAGGTPLSEPIRQVLRRGLASDPARREAEPDSYRPAVAALVYGENAAATTFSLAFFMQRRFEKTIQAEAREREAEERLATSRPAASGPRPEPARPAPSAPRARVPSTPATRPAPPKAAPVRTVAASAGKSSPPGFPLQIVALGAVFVLAIAGVWFWKFRERAAPAPAPVVAPTPAPTAPPAPLAPVVVGKEDPLFKAAVQARLEEELMKRERQRTAEQQKEQKKKQADVDRAAEEARKAQEAEEAARAARDRNDRDEALRLAREAQEARRKADEAAAKAAVPSVREGDLVEITQVDVEPAVVSTVRPEVPALAKLRKIGGTVLLRVLVTESGQTGEVEIVRDTSPRVGLGESAKAAVEKWTWTPALKDGKKVRTWTTVPIPFIVQ